MARFDFHAPRLGLGYLLDCQADSFTHRLAVPLIPVEQAPLPIARLDPIFGIEDGRSVMMTQFASATPLREMGPRAGSLVREHDRIMAALDALIIGY